MSYKVLELKLQNFIVIKKCLCHILCIISNIVDINYKREKIIYKIYSKIRY